MTNQLTSVHEPDEELLSAEDAIRDAEQLELLFKVARKPQPWVSLQVPLATLLHALDHLEPAALRLVARRAEELLAAA